MSDYPSIIALLKKGYWNRHGGGVNEWWSLGPYEASKKSYNADWDLTYHGRQVSSHYLLSDAMDAALTHAEEQPALETSEPSQ